VGLYDVIVDSADELLYHKTTARALYDRAYLEAREGGLDEVLFFNERGELTEGSRSNVFLRRGDLLLTPPVTSGLLAGVCRRDVLESGSRIRESVLFLHDLESAEEVMLANAVMGLVAARYTGLRIGANRRCGGRSA
jgi:para-aminobenzoate synthetase/4-amino-4-deoxychorismate lyase